MAAHLTERVLPRVPYRQWVLTFPRRLRLLLARRPALVGVALDVWLRALFAHQRRAARARGVRGRCGAVTFVQHFGSALQLNVHLHVVVPDGVFDDEGAFHHVQEPSCADVARLLDRTVRRLLRRLSDESVDDDIFDVDDALLSLQNNALAPLSPSPFDAPSPSHATHPAAVDEPDALPRRLRVGLEAPRARYAAGPRGGRARARASSPAPGARRDGHVPRCAPTSLARAAPPAASSDDPALPHPLGVVDRACVRHRRSRVLCV